MKARALGLLALVLLVGTPAARAAYIVDTGQPPGDANYFFSPVQYYAGGFALASGYTITSIEGYFSNEYGGPGSGNVTVALHANAGGIPGSVLNSISFAVPGFADFAWRGVTGLNWTVGPGTYWASFTPDANISGRMPQDAPSPLALQAYTVDDVWGVEYSPGMGLKIEGTAAGAPVPIPAAAWLMLSGLGGLGLLRRRKAA